MFRRKSDRTAFLWAEPAAKERGDRGRWNYPSHATAAFETVLSPGAGRTSAAGVQPPPRRVPPTPAEPVPRPIQPRGCKGRSPLHKKTKNLPLPRRGRGTGGWGKEGKLKAGLTGDKEGKPPLRLLERQGQPATNRNKSPLGARFAPMSQCRFRLSPGDARGEAPCIRKQKISPFPGGEGGGGIGERT